MNWHSVNLFGTSYPGYNDDDSKLTCLFVGTEYIDFEDALLWYFIELFFGTAYPGIGDAPITFGPLFAGTS